MSDRETANDVSSGGRGNPNANANGGHASGGLESESGSASESPNAFRSFLLLACLLVCWVEHEGC